MFVVPVEGDVINTVDGGEFITVSYTNYKNNGPCVYVKGESTTTPIYFFDIQSINGIKVAFNSQAKILEALGHFKRKIHLPQKHDKIKVEGNEDFIKVSTLKLHSRSLGLSRGLLVVGEDGEAYSLQQITEIKRPIGESFFDGKRFKKLYKDYLGYKEKK
jgi:hypothetical protein